MKCHKCGNGYLIELCEDCDIPKPHPREDLKKQFEISEEEWSEIREKFETCPLGMAMGRKIGRLTSLQLVNLITGMVEYAYLIGVQRGLNEL